MQTYDTSTIMSLRENLKQLDKERESILDSLIGVNITDINDDTVRKWMEVLGKREQYLSAIFTENETDEFNRNMMAMEHILSDVLSLSRISISSELIFILHKAYKDISKYCKSTKIDLPASGHVPCCLMVMKNSDTKDMEQQTDEMASGVDEPEEVELYERVSNISLPESIPQEIQGELDSSSAETHADQLYFHSSKYALIQKRCDIMKDMIERVNVSARRIYVSDLSWLKRRRRNNTMAGRFSRQATNVSYLQESVTVMQKLFVDLTGSLNDLVETGYKLRLKLSDDAKDPSNNLSVSSSSNCDSATTHQTLANAPKQETSADRLEVETGKLEQHTGNSQAVTVAKDSVERADMRSKVSPVTDKIAYLRNVDVSETHVNNLKSGITSPKNVSERTVYSGEMETSALEQQTNNSQTVKITESSVEQPDVKLKVSGVKDKTENSRKVDVSLASVQANIEHLKSGIMPTKHDTAELVIEQHRPISKDNCITDSKKSKERLPGCSATICEVGAVEVSSLSKNNDSKKKSKHQNKKDKFSGKDGAALYNQWKSSNYNWDMALFSNKEFQQYYFFQNWYSESARCTFILRELSLNGRYCTILNAAKRFVSFGCGPCRDLNGVLKFKQCDSKTLTRLGFDVVDWSRFVKDCDVKFTQVDVTSDTFLETMSPTDVSIVSFLASAINLHKLGKWWRQVKMKSKLIIVIDRHDDKLSRFLQNSSFEKCIINRNSVHVLLC